MSAGKRGISQGSNSTTTAAAVTAGHAAAAGGHCPLCSRIRDRHTSGSFALRKGLHPNHHPNHPNHQPIHPNHQQTSAPAPSKTSTHYSSILRKPANNSDSSSCNKSPKKFGKRHNVINAGAGAGVGGVGNVLGNSVFSAAASQLQLQDSYCASFSNYVFLALIYAVWTFTIFLFP